MNSTWLLKAVDDYLKLRRSFGYQLQIEENQLRSLAQFAIDQRHEGPLTNELAEAWARSSLIFDSYTWSRRLSVVRPFARYLYGLDPKTEIPVSGVFGPAHRRLPPFVLAKEDVIRFVDGAARLLPKEGIRPLTFSALFGLIACTGLRVSEALRLQNHDVVLDDGLLHIRKTKFQKSRLVPLHLSAIEALSRYIFQRDRFVTPGTVPAFFILDKGFPISYSRTRTAVAGVRRILEWDKDPAKSHITLRCLRHTFACQRILAWYEKGADVNHRVHALSTYLGHGKVSDTYWYLSGMPQLLAIAGSRFLSFSGEQEVSQWEKK